MDLKAILDKLRSFESNESIEQAIEQVEAMAGEQINEGMTVNKTTSVDDNGQSRETMSITADDGWYEASTGNATTTNATRNGSRT